MNTTSVGTAFCNIKSLIAHKVELTPSQEADLIDILVDLTKYHDSRIGEEIPESEGSTETEGNEDFDIGLSEESKED